MIIFTAFDDNVGLEDRHSIVQWQPKGYHLEVLPFFVSQISLARCHYNLDDYIERVQRLFLRRQQAIDDWLNSISHKDKIWLLCRCPYAKASQQQIERLGFFVCHGMVLAKYLENLGYEILLSGERIGTYNKIWQYK